MIALMDRGTQMAIKFVLSLGVSFFFGSGIDIWLPQAAGKSLVLSDLFWVLVRMLGEVTVLYVVFSVIFAIFNAINRFAKHSQFRPVFFRSPSSFWKWWLGSILFIPLWWGGHFALFFAASSTSERLITILIILAFVPLALTVIITLINLPGYIRYRFTKR